MFAFSQVEPSRMGQVSPNIGFGDFVSNSLSQGLNDGAFASVYRMAELWLEENDSLLWGLIEWDNGDKMDPEEANKLARTEGLDLNFEEPLTHRAYQIIADRKRREMERMFAIENGMTHPGRFISSLGAQMLGSMLNPIDFGTMFFPMVGSTRLAKGMAMAGHSRFSRAVNRGLLTSQENLVAKGVPFPNFVAATIDGAAGQALVEIPLMVSNLQDQAFYGPGDFALNIAAGGVFSGAVRVSLEAASDIFNKLSVRTRRNMFQKALDQWAKDEDIDVHDYVEIDEEMLWKQAQFDEAESRIKAKANAGSIEDYISDAIRDLNERGVLPKNIYTDEKGQPLVMWHATTHGTDIAGSTFHRWSHFGTLQAAVDRINLREALQQKHLTKIDRHQIRDANKPTNIAIPDRIDTNVFHRGKTITFFPVYFKARKFLRTVDDGAQHPSGIALRHVKDQLVKAGATEAEIDELAKKLDDYWIGGKTDDFSSPNEARDAFASFAEKYGFDGFVYKNDVEDVGSDSYTIFRGETIHKLGDDLFEYDNSTVRKRARQLRENAVRRFIAKEKKKYDPNKRFTELKQKEVQRQIAEGKIIHPDDIHKYRDVITTDRAIEIIEEDIRSLEEDMGIDSPDNEMTPFQRAVESGRLDPETLSPFQKKLIEKRLFHRTNIHPDDIESTGAFSGEQEGIFVSTNPETYSAYGPHIVEVVDPALLSRAKPDRSTITESPEATRELSAFMNDLPEGEAKQKLRQGIIHTQGELADDFSDFEGGDYILELFEDLGIAFNADEFIEGLLDKNIPIGIHITGRIELNSLQFTSFVEKGTVGTMEDLRNVARFLNYDDERLNEAILEFGGDPNNPMDMLKVPAIKITADQMGYAKFDPNRLGNSSDAIKPETDAIRAAVNCLINNG